MTAGLGGLAVVDSAIVGQKISPAIDTSSGRVEVIVRLSKSPAVQMPKNELGQGAAVASEQDEIIARISQIDSSARVLGQMKILLNAIMVEMDATKLPDLAGDAHVVTINPVVNLQFDQGAPVPSPLASLQAQQSVDAGTGVRVAVLDSGIDYTHAAFGGPGTPAAYQDAYGTGPSDPRNTTLDGLFPTAKVVGGKDFVGEVWPNAPLAPDPDPIDYDGHGTHVADIIAGTNGVAPGASLYAVKVCSAVANSCSGIALLKGLEYAVDPNGDGSTSDHVNIINMSLSTAYGDAYFDELSVAVLNAEFIGVLTVASAGNSGDRPYIVGAPAVAPPALAVAQTHTPDAKAYPLVVNSPSMIAGTRKNTSSLDWAPIGAGFSGDVVRAGMACSTADLPSTLAGKVALIDRGDCSASLKVTNASTAGAVGVLIALTESGDALPLPSSGECSALATGTCAPALVITQSDSDLIKLAMSFGAVNVSVSPGNAISLAESVVGTSSRGPSMGEMFPESPLSRENGYRTRPDTPQYGQLIKPEIAAPGTLDSALVGTGTGRSLSSGSSGSAAMVAGAAAVLIARSWSITPPHEIKARLMNTAETAIYLNPATSPGTLAPITRVGNGEIRLDRALDSGAAAWELLGDAGALSFGMVDVSSTLAKFYRIVEVKNYTSSPITYSIDSTFRYADDQENGAVTIRPLRRTITVPSYGSRYFLVQLRIDGTRLRPWTMNSGGGGGSSQDLNKLEYDGYLTFTDRNDATHNLHMAWHVLPRLSPDVHVTTAPTQNNLTPFTLKNAGVGSGTYYALSLLGENLTSSEAGGKGSRNPNITLRYAGAASYKYDGCTSGLLFRFGVQTWQPVSHANYPLEIHIYFDTNRDGAYESEAFTSEVNRSTAFAGDGRNATYAGPLGGPYALIPTQHGTNSGAFVLNVCGEQLGLKATDAGKLIDVKFSTLDNYYLVHTTSSISTSMSILTDRYAATDATTGAALSQITAAVGSDTSYVMRDAGDNGSSERGLLLLNTNGGKTEKLVVKASPSEP